MNTIESINKRAARIASKATALGFLKEGSPMVIDQAREVVAAEDGYRNWHALQAAVKKASTEQGEGDIHDSLVRSGDGYTLAPGENSTWITIGNLSVYVRRTDDGASVSIYPAGDEMGESLGETYAHFTESKSDKEGPGWALFESHGDKVELQIQKCDDSDVFAEDSEAWAFVIEQAIANSDSEEAHALARIKHESADEWVRIKDFDVENDGLLAKFLTSSAGHSVDFNEVAEWVGLHYQVNFDTAGARTQEWVDRFVASNEDDPRFASYLVANSWRHIFRGKREDTVRWVYRLGSSANGVVFAQVQDRHNSWVTLDKAAMADIEESIHDNDIPDTFRDEWSSEVTPMKSLPTWARH